MDLVEEFILLKRLEKADELLRRCLPFIKTWYENSHPSMGLGAKVLLNELKQFIEDGK